MQRKTKEVLVKASNFYTAWLKLLGYCLANENLLLFGGVKEAKAMKGEITSRVILTGEAILQVLNGAEFLGKIKEFPFGIQFIHGYINEFTMEALEYQRSLPEGHPGKFIYTYYERFRFYPTPNGTFDQIEALKQNLEEQLRKKVFSNRNEMITWIPYIDAFSQNPPCLQRVWITLINERSIEIHFDWRSRDLYGAWHVNLVALLNMVKRDIADPLDLEIVKVVDSCDSLHIYNGDWEKTQKVARV